MKARGNVLRVFAVALLFAASLAADTLSLKQQAKNAYGHMLYPKAQVLARRATEADPNDAEAWLLLGWYTHYRCYDTRPLSGQTRATSDSILTFLERAVQLNPKLGDAYYFIGAEYGARRIEALCRGDAEEARAELRAARAKNAYPDWTIEYCRNLLKGCAQNAILFLDYDIVVNGISYLQLIEGYRPDVTAMWMADRPWAPLLFKDGVPRAIRPAPISWTRHQIMDMHSYRWNVDTVRIPVKSGVLKNLGITSQDTSLEWEVKADSPYYRLPANTALLIDIVETNQWRRPIYYLSQMPLPASITDFGSWLQDCGLVQRLLPVRCDKYGLEHDTTTIKRVLLDSTSYHQLATVKDHDMPEAYFMLVGYCREFLKLAAYYDQSGDRNACNAVLDRMAALNPENIIALNPNFASFIEQLRKK